MSGSMRACASITSKSFPRTETPLPFSRAMSSLRSQPTFSVPSSSNTGRNAARTAAASSAARGMGTNRPVCGAKENASPAGRGAHGKATDRFAVLAEQPPADRVEFELDEQLFELLFPGRTEFEAVEL